MTVIAIDGPAGAGKSTIARAVAHALGWRYLDTGAMYRAVALAALERGVSSDDDGGLTRLASELDVRADEQSVTLDGTDVTDRVRGPEVTRVVSRVSAVPGVRQAMLVRQRALAARENVVMEGRDIGTVVVPEAELKVWLTATIGERARRRGLQLGVQDTGATLDELADSIAARDEADSARELAPLAQPKDALVLDSTDKTIDEIVAAIVSAARAVLRPDG